MTLGVIVALLLWFAVGVLFGVLLFVWVLKECLDPKTLYDVYRQITDHKP